MAELRVSDAERERAADAMREHYAEGRITSEELDARVQAAYQAQTQADLRALTTDLPQLPVSTAQRRAELAQRRAELQRRLIQQTGGGLAPFAICTVIWLASGASGPFWPVWVALAVVIPLVRNGWRLYGPAPELDRVERELERRDRHRRRDEERRAHRHGGGPGTRRL